MINVKISLPGEKTNSTFENFIDPNSKILKKIKFHINSDIEEADFWFVFEDLYKQQEKCFIDRKNIFYLNTETSFPNSYFLSTYMKEYLNQFHRQYGCYETFSTSYKNTPPFLPWMINYKSGSSIFSKVGKNKLFYDVIYNPSETYFLNKGKKLGNKYENGKQMFVYQALAAFRLWHGIEPTINNETMKLLNR